MIWLKVFSRPADPRRDEQGIVFISALFAIVITMVAGALLVSISSGELRLSTGHRLRTKAFDVAEAGIDHAMWKLQGRPDWRDGYSNTEFDDGKYTVTATDLGGGSADLRLTSTGKFQAARRKVIADVKFVPHPAIKYALFSEQTLNFGNLFLAKGDVRTNGDFNVNANVQVQGNIQVSGAINQKLGTNLMVSGSTEVGIAPLTRPKPPLRWFELNADQILEGNRIFYPPGGGGGFLTQLIDGLIVVKGDVTIQGRVRNQTVIVASGNININGNIDYQQGTDAILFLFSFGTTTMTGEAQIDSCIFSYGPVIDLSTRPGHVFGTVLGASLDYNMQLQIEYDPRCASAKLPGLPFQEFKVVRWEEVFQF
ncbi:MAG: hypothetical protein HYY09_02150 [Firmicutes bacterium]|nr:hypothetical protein [Bacillota bacterium]